MSTTSSNPSDAADADPQARVCPECGTPALAASFCSGCGLNLAVLERLPTREAWEQSTNLAQNVTAEEILDQLARIEGWTVALFDVPEASRAASNLAVIDAVRNSVRCTVESAMPDALRDSDQMQLDVASGCGEATATIVLESGITVRQPFAFKVRGPRAAIERSAPAQAPSRSGAVIASPAEQTRTVFPTPATPNAMHQTRTTSAPEASAVPPNPAALVAACIALIAGALIIVSSFVQIHHLGLVSGDLPHNSFIADGDWWVLVAGFVLAVAALNALFGVPKNSIGPMLLASVGGVVAGILGLGSGFQTFTINPAYQQLLGASTVKASPGIGVYLALAGGGVGLLAGLMLISARQAPRAR